MDKIMRGKMRKLLFVLGLFISGIAYAAPSNTVSIPNSFTANTTIQSAQVNDDFNEVSNKYNAHSHSDITQLGTITAGIWSGTPVTTQFGGTGQDFSAVASGAVMYFNGTGTTTTLAKGASGSILYLNGLTQQLDWLAQGSNGQVLRSNGAKANPSFSNSGKVVQVVNTQSGAVSTTATVLPSDDTIPQITEGAEFMTRTITPTSATNILRIDVVIYVSHSADTICTAALFQDAIADALAAGFEYTGTAQANLPQVLTFTHFMTSGTTSAITFRVRAGGSDPGTLTVNGRSTLRLYGGITLSSITVTEYLP
jgi:uncharacterized cupin superfamily protein